MDPNANLEEQRRIIESMLGDCVVHDMDDADRLAELARALDEWISGGGMLPDAWLKSSAVPQLVTLISPCVDCGAEGGQPCKPECTQESYQ